MTGKEENASAIWEVGSKATGRLIVFISGITAAWDNAITFGIVSEMLSISGAGVVVIITLEGVELLGVEEGVETVGTVEGVVYVFGIE